MQFGFSNVYLLLSLWIFCLSSAALDKETLMALEANFVRKFNLDSRPRPKRRIIPEYIEQLYQERIHRNKMLTNQNSFDSARSFFPQDLQQISTPDNSTLYNFDIEAVPNWEFLESAELRLHITGSSPSPMTTVRQSHIRIEVHEIVRDHTVLLDTNTVQCVDGQYSISLDLTATVARWRTRPDHHGAVQVRVQPTPGAWCAPKLSPRPISKNSPVLIVYSSDHQNKHSRSKRSTDEKHNKRHQKKKARRRHRLRHKGRVHERELCRRAPLRVDFEEVGWQDWIVAPPAYEAFMCQGSCPYPMPDSLNTTNHAIVQSLVNSVTPGAVPPACCVPTKLESISFLYIDQYDSIVLRTYDDMVVTECGCQ